MGFQRREINASASKPSYKSTRVPLKKIKKKSSLGFAKNLRKIILYSLIGFIVVGGVSTIILYKKFIEPLPSIDELENLEIAESSTIYDRNGEELYSIFTEKRTYVGYNDINQYMVHAIVAGEDKRFFENPGVDIIGLIRAVLYRVTGKSDSLGGTSTLTQQLIRNTIIENRSSGESLASGIERKIKEIYLAYKLTNGVSKEKILELYLNKISFWSNAYGIEQAAKTFFWKSSKDIGVLESSVLASLPKGPTFYSPYNNYDRVMGYPYFITDDDAENTIDLVTKEDIEKNSESVEKLVSFIEWLKLQRLSESRAILCGLSRENVKEYISVDTDGCSVLSYSELLPFLNGIKISLDETNILEYQTGRKDFILGRMLEDDYINFDEYKGAITWSFWYTFVPYSENIKFPHFVFYIREYLEEKYGKDVIEKWGFKIYTSIDAKAQEKAEEIVAKQVVSNKAKYDANNAALVSIDNRTGEIIAMVWGTNYFDTENKGNVNIITSRLQPGSSFKPFVYSMAVDKEVVGTKTPVYDVKTIFPGNYTPDNFDGKFMGKMTITTALNYSRNIPAVKMFYLAGGEQSIIDFMGKLGVTTLADFKKEYFENYGKEYSYGASMSLWTGLVTPLEMAQAYSVYANMGIKKELVPITKILDSKGLVIEEFKPEDNRWEEVLDPSTAFIMNYMMSDTASRPTFWNNYLSLSGRAVAAKTGTSSKQWTENGKDYIFPRNLWTIGYTPEYTTVVWAGNNDGKELKYAGNGLEGAGPIWKQFMEYIHIGEPVQNWSKPSGVKEVPISKISGYNIPEWYDSSLIVNSYFKNSPTLYDTNLTTVDVDILCDGAVWPNTPAAAIKQVTLLAFHSLQPQNAAWENPVQAWVINGGYKAELGDIPNIIGYVSSETCERPDVASDIQIATTTQNGETIVVWSNYIELAYRSNNPIQNIEVFLGTEKIKDIDVGNELEWTYKWEVFISKGSEWSKQLKFRAVDSYYYSATTSVNVTVSGTDPNPPKITMTNPIDSSIKLYKWDFFNLKWTVEDKGTIRSINIYINGNAEKIGLTGRDFNYPIGSLNLEIGNHIITVEAVGNDLKVGKAEVRLEVLANPNAPVIQPEETPLIESN